MANIELTDTDDFPADTIGGSEKIPVADGSTAKHITPDLLSAYVIDQIEAADALADIGTDDSFVVLEDDGKLEECTFEVVEAAINAAMWAESNVAALADADAIIVRDGGVAGTDGTATLSTLATYMLAELEPSILDISDKDASSTPADAHLVLTVNGTTPKKTTWAELRASVLGGFDTYMNALDAVTSTNDADVLYCTQSGTEKKITLSDITDHIDYPINGSGAAGYLADWSDADTLQNTYAMVTSFAAGSNAEVATSKAIRDEMDDIIYDATAMGAALADADTFLMNDGDTATTQKKATLTQLNTWINTHYAVELESLTAAEVTQLQAIGTTTISAAQWGYLGGASQAAHIADPAATATDPDAITAGDPTLDASDITDSTGGTPSGTHTLVDVATDTWDNEKADVENNFATIAAEYNGLKDDVEANEAELEKLIDDVTSIRTQLVALIDDVQANNAAIDSINAAQAGFGVTASS